MTDDPSDKPSIPQAVPVRKRRWAISLVWIIPIVAALVGGWVALHYILSRGPTITIDFKNAEGLEATKTKVRYKDVDIGTVTAIEISRDRSHVTVTAQLAKQAENLLAEDTRFWVVRPRVTLNSITGLGTLLSGAYIGVDAGKTPTDKRHFAGLDIPPPVTSDSPGKLFQLKAEDIGSLYVGAPVFFRRVPVGNVTNYKLDDDGKGVTLEIFVNAPHDKLVTANSRFWHASGIDISLGGSGVKLNTESITSIIAGGISFQPPPEGEPGPVVPGNTSFILYADKTAALKRIGQETQTYLLYFSESLRGLSPGAPVDFRGIVIGEVKAVSVEYDRDSKELRFPVEINIYPEQMRSRYRQGSQQMSMMEREPHALLDRLVARGFRAQLKSANLLTGQLYVALDFFPRAPKAAIDWGKNPAVLPTVAGALEDIQQTLGDIAAKLDKVPFDTIGTNMNQTLRSLNTTLQSADKLVQQLDASVLPEVKGTIAEARKTLGSAQQTLATDAPVQQDLRETLRDVGRAAQSLRDLADYLNRHPESLIRGRREKD
ncbi:paraquat-inducible protein B [Noviherbaspirillum humi]|uniref:Paraquat-inducible protein B n=1 Tax=Noviherbaspirillum humi TaxID=1688639 RepID=A0A239F7R1_9BURK|nr:MlaD family protein [Noviherbaspirillum humi]SNS52855.1 paraquat-inducible protein B [Noviherbaspirillum humi]